MHHYRTFSAKLSAYSQTIWCNAEAMDTRPIPRYNIWKKDFWFSLVYVPLFVNAMVKFVLFAYASYRQLDCYDHTHVCLFACTIHHHWMCATYPYVPSTLFVHVIIRAHCFHVSATCASHHYYVRSLLGRPAFIICSCCHSVTPTSLCALPPRASHPHHLLMFLLEHTIINVCATGPCNSSPPVFVYCLPVRAIVILCDIITFTLVPLCVPFNIIVTENISAPHLLDHLKKNYN